MLFQGNRGIVDTQGFGGDMEEDTVIGEGFPIPPRGSAYYGLHPQGAR